jgi:hypothetical protein
MSYKDLTMENSSIAIDQNINSLMYKHGKDLDEAIQNLRKDLLRAQAESLVDKLLNEGRCPKCTLKLPCKHFQTPSSLPSDIRTGQISPAQESSTPSSLKSRNHSTNSITKTFKIRYRGRSKESPKPTCKVDEFQKLKIMEKLEKYKEEKLLKEIQLLEDLKKNEEIIIEKQKQEQKKREDYYFKQKNKLSAYREELKVKMDLLVQRKLSEEIKEKLSQARYQKIMEEKKNKVSEYRLKKQVVEGISNQSLQDSIHSKKSPTRKNLKSLKILRVNKTYLQ